MQAEDCVSKAGCFETDSALPATNEIVLSRDPLTPCCQRQLPHSDAASVLLAAGARVILL